MSANVIKKGENHHQRVDGSGVGAPRIANVAGNGGEYTQAWKSENGPNWIDRSQKVPKSNATKAFFKHRG